MKDDKVYLDFRSPEIATPCLICGDEIPVYGLNCRLQVCDKCREAVMVVRATIDKTKEEKARRQ